MDPRPKKRSRKVPSPTPNELSGLPTIPSGPASRLTEEDLIALNLFSDSVDLEEISLESWEATLTSLRVTVPVWLEPKLACDGGDITVKYTRRILSRSENGILKESVQVTIPLPSGMTHGQNFVWPGLGDCRDGLKGDLVVIVQVKKPSKPT